MSTPEGQIKNKIFEYLETRTDIKKFWNHRSSGIYNPMSGYRKAGKYDLKGISDICGFFKNGTMFGAEVKTPIGKPSKEQLEWINLLNDLGHIAGFVRSVEDMKSLLDQGLLKKKKSRYPRLERH